MQIEPGFLCSLHTRPTMTSCASETMKVRRKLFADTSPINYNKLKNDTERIINADSEQFQAKYNFDLDAKKPLPGNWEWRSSDSEEVPSFYIRPYPAKTAESLRNHLMACVKTRDQILRNTFYRNGQFKSLANVMTTCTSDEPTTTLPSTIHPVVLPETPMKGTILSFRPTSCGTNKRKLSQTDFNKVEGDNNTISPNSSSSPLCSQSPSGTETTPKLSCESQESVGQNLQNIPCSTTTDNESSSQSTQTSSLAQQDKQTRQTNITEYMKSQKNPSSEPTAKHARRS